MWSERTSLVALERAASWKIDERATVESRSGFARREIGALVRLRRLSIDPTREPERCAHYVGLEHVESRTGELRQSDRATRRVPRSRCKGFAPGDVLYGRLRPYLNKVYHEPADGSAGACSPEFIVLEPRTDRVDPVFLRALLASPYVLDAICACQAGTTLPRVDADDLLEIRVPLPPLDVQRQVSADLERAREARRALEREMARLERDTQERFTRAIEETRGPERLQGESSAEPEDA